MTQDGQRGRGAARVAAAALAATVALGPAQAFALAGPAPTADTVAGGEPPARTIDPARIEVRVFLDGDESEASRRIGDAMRAVIEDRMVAYDDELGPKGPTRVVLRVVIDEAAAGQGFVGKLLLGRDRARVVSEVECSPCGGTEFLATLRVHLDRTAATLAGTPDIATPPPVVTPADSGSADRPAPAPMRPWIKWTGLLGFSGLFLTAASGPALIASAGMLGAWATGRDPFLVYRDLGASLAITGGLFLVVGVPMLAVDRHRYRKARRIHALNLGPATMAGGGALGGLSLRGRF